MANVDQPFFTPDELGTARRLAWNCRGRLIWCETWQRWLVSDRRPGVWLVDEMVTHRRLAIETAMQQDAEHNPPAGAPGRRVKYTSASHIANALTLAKPLLAASLADFDTNPMELNTPSGVVDLETGELRGWALEDAFMRQTKAGPLKEEWTATDTPLWTRHLIRMCKGNLEIMAYLRRLAGMTLIGDQNLKPHCSPQLNGMGRNGKGVFLQGLAYALGDYAQFASTRLLTTTENAHTTEQAGLRGMRLVVVEEVKRINSSLLKDLTGGGTLRARLIKANDEAFLKSWTIWFNNNGPMFFSGDQSDGLWQRVPTVDLGAGIPEEERVDEMAVLLQEEASGILSWALLGLKEFQEIGMQPPAVVLAATATRRSDADPMSEYLNEYYERDASSFVLGSDFVRYYTDWAKDREERTGGMRAVYADLRSRFNLTVRPGHDNKTCIYGIRKKPMVLADEARHWN